MTDKFGTTLRLGRCLEVYWHDAAGPFSAAWVSVTPDNLKKCRVAVCRTVGYLVRKRKHSIALASSVGDFADSSHFMGDVNVIPRGTIIKIKRLA